MVSEPNTGRYMPSRRLRRVDMRRCASKDAGPKGGRLGGQHRLEKGTSISEDTGPPLKGCGL